VPSVAGDSGGASEAVTDGETGFVIGQPSDAGAVADRLQALLIDDGLRHRMGSAARTRAVAEFDHDVLAKRLLEALS
jgi:phosphatidylinositol alpha-1,6-mannosyltransferase